jgi:hypothetical protein
MPMHVLPPDIASFQALLNSTKWMDTMDQKFSSSSLLHEMIKSNEDVDFIELLINSHSTMKLKKSKPDGLLPIMAAVTCQNLRIVQLLLQSHVAEQVESRPSIQCTKTYTPFIEAVRVNNIEIARQLFRAGADVNAAMTLKERNKHHSIGSPLYLMSQRSREFPGGIRMMKILVHEFGANPNCTATVRTLFGEEANRTGLFGAVARDDIEMIQELLSYGCDIDARDSSGKTALWLTFGTMRGTRNRLSSPDTALMLTRQFGASLKKCIGGKRHVGEELNGRFLETIEMVNESAGSAGKNDKEGIHRRKETKRLMHVLQRFQQCSQGRINCDETETENRFCGRCKTVSYCCRKHQREDWHTHKTICKEIQKYRALVEKVKSINGYPIVKVQMHGLKSKPEWNGLIGTRSLFNQTKHRYLIVFDDLNLPNVHMKEENIVVLDDGKMNDEQERMNTAAITDVLFNFD